jgi:uncharacterized membrane protein YfcA
MLALIVILLSLSIMALIVPLSMVGMGGGSIYVPLLTTSGILIHEASIISLFVVIAASASAFLIFRKNKTLDWKLLLIMAPIAIIGSLTGGYIAQFINDVLLKIIFVIILIISTLLMLHPATKEGKHKGFVPQVFSWKRKFQENEYTVSLGFLFPLVFIISFIASMLGVGGGVFLIPVLIILFGIPTRIAVGLSSAYIGISSFAGLTGQLIGGNHLNLVIAIPFAIAAIIGARIGATLSHKLQPHHLRLMVSGIIGILAAWMLVSIFI